MITIGLAKKEDLARLYRIELETITPPWTEEALLREITKDDTQFFIAENCQGELLGFAILRQVGYEGELLQIAVDKSSWRQGVGDLLMNKLLDYADEHLFESVFLEVRYRNNAAVSLYEKHGFKTLRVRKNYYESPVEDALVMTRGQGLIK